MKTDGICTCALDIAARTGWTVGPWFPESNRVDLPAGAKLGDGTAGGAVDLGPKGPDGAAARLFGLRKLITDLKKAYSFTRISVEDAAYGSKNQFAVQILHGEYRGVARLTAHQLGCEFVLIKPQKWKHWLTGNQRADKEQCAAALAGQFGVRFSDQNECDSYAILLATLAGVR